MIRIATLIIPLIAAVFLFACSEELTDQERIENVRTMVQAENHAKAILEVTSLIDGHPSDSILLYWGAKAYLATGETDTAVSYAKKLTSLYPSHIEGYRLLYDAAEEVGDHASQLWAVSQMGYYVLDRRRYYNEIAELNFKLGEFGMAIRTCNDILEYDPDNLRVMFLLASSLATTGRFDSAIAVMERIDRLYPDNIEVKSNLGSYLVEVGRFQDAEFKFLEIVRADPEFLPGWYGLGNVLLERGDTAGAVDAYRHVYDRDPSFLDIDSVLKEIDPALMPDPIDLLDPGIND